MKSLFNCLALALCLSMAGCEADQAEQDTIPVSLTGVDHLAEHLAVLGFSVDGAGSFQAARGGSVICCVNLPRRWHPGLQVKVKWNVIDFRDCRGDNQERMVPVDRYEEAGDAWVHFLADGSIRIAPIKGSPGDRSPGDQALLNPVPEKAPWTVYPLDDICAAKTIAMAQAKRHARE